MGWSHWADARSGPCGMSNSTANCDGRSSRTDYHNSGIRQRERTHCPQGHEYTPENTRIQIKRDRGGERTSRHCRVCSQLTMQRKRQNPKFRAKEAEKMRNWRQQNREAYLTRVREERRKKKEWLDSQKVKCARCPETHPACMDFHHRDPSQKDGNLSQMAAKWPLEKTKAEVAKCDVLCANCHRKLHRELRNAGRVGS